VGKLAPGVPYVVPELGEERTESAQLGLHTGHFLPFMANFIDETMSILKMNYLVYG
jgi:hypothetical protein